MIFVLLLMRPHSFLETYKLLFVHEQVCVDFKYELNSVGDASVHWFSPSNYTGMDFFWSQFDFAIPSRSPHSMAIIKFISKWTVAMYHKSLV